MGLAVVILSKTFEDPSDSRSSEVSVRSKERDRHLDSGGRGRGKQQRCGLLCTHGVTDLLEDGRGDIGSLLEAARDADRVDAAERHTAQTSEHQCARKNKDEHKKVEL